MTDCSELERRDFEKLVRDLEEQVKCLQRCLNSRDDFLCDHGMFGKYMAEIDDRLERSKVPHEERVATALKTLIPSRPAKGGDL